MYVYINLKTVRDQNGKYVQCQGIHNFSLIISYFFGLFTGATMLEGLVEMVHTPQPVGPNKLSTVVHLPLSGKTII
jgi:hypothetical protein